MTMHGAGFALYHPPVDGEILDLSKKQTQTHTYLSPPPPQGELLYMLGQPPLASPPPQPASRVAKATRPFKAYPKDPLSLSLGVAGNADVLLGHDPNQAYAEFRRRMLEQVQAASRPPQKRAASPGPGPGPSPGPQQPSSSEADRNEAYWERRRKNNEAAKRSRDARRAKEDEIAIRAAFLEQENMKLRYEVAALRTETGKLRCLLYNR